MKVLKTILTFILAIVILAGLAVGGSNIYIRTSNSDFFKTAEKEFKIPGLSEGFVPQGIAYDENSGYYLISGYMSDNSTSRVYTVDPETSDFTYVNLNNEKGEADAIHAGGIAVYGRYVFVTTGTENINVYRLAEVTDSDLNNAEPFASFTAGNTPESLSISSDYLYLGEYYDKEAYDTPDSHHFETESGEALNAVALVYDITDVVRALSAEEAALTPVAAYAVTDHCQGFCVLKGGQLCLTTSGGLKNSALHIYDDPFKTNLTSDAMFETKDGEKAPLYFLDSESQLKTYSLPPMAEEVIIEGDKVLVMNSSASNKSLLGKITGGNHCRSFMPEF